MKNIFPAKAFYKIITENDQVKEIHYICSDEQGELFIEIHNNKDIKKIKLIPEE